MSNSPVLACPSCGTRNRVPAGGHGRPRCARCHAWLPWAVEATAADFDEIASTSPVPVLVDLWAPWCGPCRVLSPIVQKMANRFAGRLKVVKVNVDEAPALSARFGVQGIPTLVLLQGGQVLARQVGAVPEGALAGWVESHLPADHSSSR